MAIIENDINLENLITITSSGSVVVASQPEIRNAIVKKFKSIYGNDIDITPQSVDGQYVTILTIMINNILQYVQQAFNALDPATANDKYLEILCAFNNVFRKQPEASSVQLVIRNTSETTVAVQSLFFVDKNNNTWTWNNAKDINGNFRTVFEPHTNRVIVASCDELGPIACIGSHSAPPVTEASWSSNTGEIYEIVNTDEPLIVWQQYDATLGNYEESNDSLRSRRYQMLGNQAVSVLQGLQGTLLGIQGIKDCFIYNNYTNSAVTLNTAPIADGTSVGAHSIYIALRYDDSASAVAPNETLIGGTIYNKMTPGILTTQTADTGSSNESFTIQKTQNLTYTVYWKKCGYQSPTIVLTYSPFSNFNKDLVENSVKESLQSYINNIKINGYMSVNELRSAMEKGDVLTSQSSSMSVNQGIRTFTVTNCTINNNAADYPANLKYFKYTSFVWNTTDHTLTIS